MKPVIGIPLGFDDRERWKPGRRYLYLDERYSRAVERCGGVPMLLPMQDDVAALAARIDALLVPGGDDFVPEVPYPPDVSFDPVPPAQAAFDDALLGAALGRDLPVLGICYGAQLLALHHAGRLHYHLPLDVPKSAPHALPEPDGRHSISAEPGALLARLIDAEAASVNSQHHQAIAEPGNGLRVCARAEDGVIEAVESTERDFVLGVQWHPERLPGAAGEALIAALVAACH